MVPEPSAPRDTSERKVTSTVKQTSGAAVVISSLVSSLVARSLASGLSMLDPSIQISDSVLIACALDPGPSRVLGPGGMVVPTKEPPSLPRESAVQRHLKKKKEHRMKVERTLKELNSEILQKEKEYEVLSANNSMLNDIWDTQVEVVPSIGLSENEKKLKIILKEKAALLESKPPPENKANHYYLKSKRLLQLEEDEVTAKKSKVKWLVQDTARLKIVVQRKKVQTKQIVQNRMF